MRRSATTANAVMGMLALRERWPMYELTKQLRRNMRFFWPRAESRIYAEAKRLVDRGLASSTTSRSSGERSRTTYRITRAGRGALREWLATPPAPTTLECEGLLRVFLADFAEHDDVIAAVAQVRADALAILEVGAVVGPEYLEHRGPFQDQVHVRGIVFDFLSNHALMLLHWADRTEELLNNWPDWSLEERAQASLDLIERTLRTYPPGGSSGP